MLTILGVFVVLRADNAIVMESSFFVDIQQPEMSPFIQPGYLILEIGNKEKFNTSLVKTTEYLDVVASHKIQRSNMDQESNMPLPENQTEHNGTNDHPVANDTPGPDDNHSPIEGPGKTDDREATDSGVTEDPATDNEGEGVLDVSPVVESSAIDDEEEILEVSTPVIDDTATDYDGEEIWK